MTENYKDKVAMIVDSGGWYLELAVKLSESFKKVYYYNFWISPAPTSNPLYIGEGIDGVEKVDYLFDKVDAVKADGTPEVDIFIFPDIYSGDLQLHLEKLGRLVFGSRKSDELEIYRFASRRHLKELGLKQSEGELITGLDNLREYLKKNEDVYIKISFTRGDDETWHSINYATSRQHLDNLAVRLGAKQDIMKWLVTKPIEKAIEAGIDTICIDGQYPKKCTTGIEVKDASYVCKVVDFDKIPYEIKETTDALSEDLKKYRHRNFFCTENRIQGKGKSFPIDLTMRGGIPPYEIHIELIKNLAEVIYKGASGEIVEWEIEFEYACQVTIIAHEAAEDYQCIQFPKEIKPFVKLRSFVIQDGDYYIVPSPLKLIEVGAVLGFGHTLKEAIDHCKKNAEQVKGFKIEIDTEKLDSAEKELEKAKEMGINLFEE
jgi:hypothetical protein